MNKKALAVDDSPTMRAMVSRTLKSAGYDVVEAQDGVEALAALGEHEFQVVITDLNMPNLDGFGLTGALRAMPAYRVTPILILTTEADQLKKDRGRAIGATGWIVKPFHPEKLLQVVSRVCG